MKYDAEYFDAVYAESDGDPWGYWDSEYEHRKAERTVAALRDRRSPADVDPVLDVGCGNGAKTATLAEAYPAADVVGVDISREALSSARERAPDATYERVDAVEYLAETDRTFDAVVAVDSLHYLGAHRTLTDLLAFATDLRGVLASDGVLVATHLHMPRGDGPLFAQARSTATLRGLLETAFETVGRERYDARKRTALDEDEPSYQPYEVWTMVPRTPDDG